MLDATVTSFALRSLPPAPARVLEVGAGEGELALVLSCAGYDVVAIDPASTSEKIRPVALAELCEPPRSFDAAVAVVSLHHVEPLGDSCRRLAEVVRPGGTLVLDEIDVARFDERGAQWWLEQRGPHGHDPGPPGEIVGWMRHHLHDLRTMQGALEEWFELGPPVRGPYLYRWELSPELRGAEEELIAADRLAAVGVRLVGTRRPGRA
ncbi:MAG: class I SAM-dependent methyltransferase [Solirubrobacterales bacterium]|nr:class I SAM-dependent methyltransferase [Solirubrobacterales bacterium]